MRDRIRVYIDSGTDTKGKGLLLFFTHLSSGHKGIVSAMATEPIPVRATFPKPVSSVEVSFWASTGIPAVLEAFDADGKVSTAPVSSPCRDAKRQANRYRSSRYP